MPRLLPPAPSFDLTKLDVTALTPARVAVVARDIGYVAIGFGVLAVQRIQVSRRDIERAIGRTVKVVATQAK